MEWINLKTLGKVRMELFTWCEAHKTCSRSISKGIQEILFNALVIYMLSIDQEGPVVYNLFLQYAPGGSLLDLMIKEIWGQDTGMWC
ncbi:hypothetical protein QQP08_018899 [Theobroma cacao]|nr:hypothetical protein QQP08_018899 [Theobroma cacao]